VVHIEVDPCTQSWNLPFTICPILLSIVQTTVTILTWPQQTLERSSRPIFAIDLLVLLCIYHPLWLLLMGKWLFTIPPTYKMKFLTVLALTVFRIVKCSE
jgi:hypothetical protein